MNGREQGIGICSQQRKRSQHLARFGVGPVVPQPGDARNGLIGGADVEWVFLLARVAPVSMPFKKTRDRNQAPLPPPCRLPIRWLFVDRFGAGINCLRPQFVGVGFRLHPMRNQPPADTLKLVRLLASDNRVARKRISIDVILRPGVQVGRHGGAEPGFEFGTINGERRMVTRMQ